MKGSLFLALVFIFSVAARAQDIQQTLKDRYEGKFLVLRHSLQQNKQEYSSDGQVVNPGAEGPWTLYGRMRVDHLELSASTLSIKGNRVDCKLDRSRRLALYPNKTAMQVNISLPHFPGNVEEAEAILGTVFAVTKDDVIHSAPEFWRKYLDANIPPIPGKETPAVSQNVPQDKAEAPGSGATTPELTAKAFYPFGPGVKAPQAVYTPEPVFPAKASKENYVGVVVLSVIVDATGKVNNIRVVRPMGMGLDEAAVAAVKTWRFKPAEHSGQPVATAMNIEVAFNKY